MQNLKKLIQNYLQNYLDRKRIDVKFEVSVSTNLANGDFASNIALVLSNQNTGDNPRLTAEKIKVFLDESNELREVIEKVEVAGPGFINFFLNQEYLSKSLQEITQPNTEFGNSNTNPGQKTIVEFGDPNPFKEIHIGHLRNFCIGESYSRLLETQRNEVIRANYQGDVGMHVAKCLWGLLHGSSPKTQDSELTSLELANAYAYGATKFEEDEEVKKEITEINKRIYNDDPELKPLWEKGRKVSLNHFEELYSRIGIKYDKYYFESVTAKRGKELVLSHVNDGVFEKNDGAIVYRGEQDGLHTRVFVTSQDYATYEGKDLALAVIKNEEVGYDRSVVLTGNEQLEYFQVMLAALKRIAPELADKTSHYTFGHVRLKEGKMSSRTGDVITANWLLDEAVKRVNVAFPDMDSDTAEKVGVGAVKYSMLKFSIPSDIHFDFEESISIEGNSGPYLQYTYVRTQSVLNKAQEVGSGELRTDSLVTEEKDLLRFLTQFPYHVEIAASEFAPNLLCNYLFELSQKFNLFYQKHKIIGSEDEAFRLELTKAVGIVLQKGLQLLGISTVARM